jgi:hypothetical protein
VLPELVEPALDEFAEIVKSGEMDALPYSAHDPLKEFTAFIKRRNCEAHFSSINGQTTTKLIITPDIELNFPGFITGETTIYGRILRVGGKEPKVMFEPFSGMTIYCNVSEDLAKKLGEYLYTEIALKGIAKWNPHTLDLCNFKITGYHEFKSGNIQNAFSELSKLIGKYFSDVDDVDGYVADLRGRNGAI